MLDLIINKLQSSYLRITGIEILALYQHIVEYVQNGIVFSNKEISDIKEISNRLHTNKYFRIDITDSNKLRIDCDNDSYVTLQRYCLDKINSHDANDSDIELIKNEISKILHRGERYIFMDDEIHSIDTPNTSNTTKRKEENTMSKTTNTTNNKQNIMSNFKFGKFESDRIEIRLSPYGLAVKNSSEKFVAYDKTSKQLIDVSPVTFDMGSMIYQMPVQSTLLKVGDCILHNNTIFCITEVGETIKGVCYYDSCENVIKLTTNMFGFNFVTKIVSITDMMMTVQGIPSTDNVENPTQNMMLNPINMLAFSSMLDSDCLEGMDFGKLMMMQMMMPMMSGNMMPPMQMVQPTKPETEDK